MANEIKDEENQPKKHERRTPHNDKGTIISRSVKSKASLLPKRTGVAKMNAQKRAAANQADSFADQPIDFSKYIYLPEKYEKLFIFIYILTIPYLFGLIFLFFFVAHTNVTNFTTLDLTTFLIVWAIGYEIVGTLLLLMIFYSAFSFKKQSRVGRRKAREADESIHKVYDLS